jgi:hypothetical protein
MRNANRPAGPGKLTNERRDAVVEQEEIDETLDEAQGVADSPPRDPTRSARQAERDAHAKPRGNDRSGISANRRRS